MLPATEATPLMPARGGGKEWQQKRSFHVSSRCFFSQNMTKGKLQKATIKPTFGPQERFQSSPQMNQNALLMQEEGIHAKRKRIEQFDSEEFTSNDDMLFVGDSTCVHWHHGEFLEFVFSCWKQIHS